MSAQAEQASAAARRRKRRTAPADDDTAFTGEVHPRTGARRTVMHVIRQIPEYLRLLGGLLTDRRVALVDKLLVAGAIAYIVSPADLIPDVIPFLGQVDDVFLLTASIERLIRNAGSSVVTGHWRGDPNDLSSANLRQVLMAASFFLPRRVRRRLRVLGRKM